MACYVNILVFLVYIFTILPSDGGEYCRQDFFSHMRTKYCAYGCCGWYEDDCCSPPFNLVGLIVGLCVGAAVLITIICVVVCICRRRRVPGIIVSTQPGAVVQQTTVTSQSGSYGQHQAGIMYPPQQPSAMYPPQPGYNYPPPPAYVPPQPYGAYGQPSAYPPTGYPAQLYPLSPEAPPYDLMPEPQPGNVYKNN